MASCLVPRPPRALPVSFGYVCGWHTPGAYGVGTTGVDESRIRITAIQDDEDEDEEEPLE